MTLSPRWRMPLLVLGMVALVVGVLAGLARLGWRVPQLAAGAAGVHGALMISGFFGTVISLERAVALRSPWTYLGPLCAGAGALALVAGAPQAMAAALAGTGSAVLLAGSVLVYARQRAAHTLTLALGAACWLAGNALWLAGEPIHRVLAPWTGFLVLTIAGERLELSRMLPPSAGAKRTFAAIVAVMLAALAASSFRPEAETAFAAMLGVLALWLLKQDIARRTVRQQGLTRYIALCLLSGYVWLGFAAVALAAGGGFAPGGPGHDAGLHALLIGFVLSMVLGHAPIIFPAVLGLRLAWYPLFYLPLAALHASLLARVAGDIAGAPELRAAGALGNALALLLFVLTMIGAALRARGRKADATG